MYRFFFVFFIFSVFTLPLNAQESAMAETKSIAEGAVREKTPTLDDAKTVDEIQEFMSAKTKELQNEVAKIAQSGEITAEKISGFLRDMSEHTIAAGKKVLQIAKDDAEKETGYKMALQGLKQLDQCEKIQHLEKLKKEANISEEDEQNPEKMMPLARKVMAIETDAKKQLDALMTEIETSGKFKDLLNLERFQLFQMNSFMLSSDFTLQKFEAFKKEAKDWINEEGIPPTQSLMLLVDAASSEEAAKVDPGLAEKTIKELVAFVESSECKVPEEDKKELLEILKGFCRRCIGSDLKLYGKTIEDKDFNWESLRGKVVLVKFTASWCPPCKAQIPFMLKAYEKYKNKGFEIVSVYVMDQLAASKQTVESEKLPWIILSEELTEKAGEIGQGKTYAIQSVPTMLLVDKEGKVVDTEARGPSLEEKLSKLLDIP